MPAYNAWQKGGHMSVYEPKRTESIFQVIDNVEKICNRIIVLTNTNFGLAVQQDGREAGIWKDVTEQDEPASEKHVREEYAHAKNGKKKICASSGSQRVISISLQVQSRAKNLNGASLIIEMERDGKIFVYSHKTWLVNKYKDEMWEHAQKLSCHIRTANGINPILREEYIERRLHQDRALAECKVLLDLLKQCTQILHTRPSKIEPIINLLNQEVALIQGWRRSDYKKLHGCMKNEQKIQLRAIEAVQKDLVKKAKKTKKDSSIITMLEVLQQELEEIRVSGTVPEES
jgi:hypothetical protein